MKQYEYKFVEVTAKAFPGKPGGLMEKCKEIIQEEAQNGWRLKQVLVPFHEKFGIYGAAGYQIILEREL